MYYCGVLDHSASHPEEEYDVLQITSDVKRVAREDPDIVVQLNLSQCRLGLAPRESLASTVESFTWLSVVKLNACGIHGNSMIMLLYRVLCLPSMQGTRIVQNVHSEISIQCNDINDDTIRRISEIGGGHIRTSPALGLHRLDISYNNVTDLGIHMLSSLTPRLAQLYLSGNRAFTGTHLHFHLTKFAPLSILAMDKTSVDKLGISNLLAGLMKRKTLDTVPVELWMRSMTHPPMDYWCKLMDFCCAKVDTQKKFRVTIKHDLQNGVGHWYPRAAPRHDSILMRLFLNGWSPVEVRHFDIPSDLAVARLVTLAMSEITAVCFEDTTRIAKASARGVRVRYCAALRHIVKSGDFFMKVFKLDTARLVYVNKYTNEKVVVGGVYNELFGVPKPGWSIEVEVAVEVEVGGSACERDKVIDVCNR